MTQGTTVRRLVCLLVVILCLSTAAVAHAQSPEGHWVAEHPSSDGMGSWWDFHKDGTFIVYQGAMVTSPINHNADTIALPATTAGAPPNHIKFHVEANTLHLISPTGADISYTRVGPAPSATDALLGKWRPVPPKTFSSDPKTAAIQRSNANALYVFGPDNTESVRIPFSARPGTWDLKTQIFQYRNDRSTYSFRFEYGKLLLGQPPDGKKTETYIPDPIL